MSDAKLHADEADIDAVLARRLVVAQFPQWGQLPLRLLQPSGTDNVLFHLGVDKIVRLPRTSRAARQVAKEQAWLARLAPQLPLAVPVPLAAGRATETYPWNWSIYPWLEGEDAHTAVIDDRLQAATDLGDFVAVLQRLDARGGPRPGIHNAFRGAPLARREPAVRAALAQLRGTIDVATAAAAWQEAVNAPPWEGPPVWLHGDLQPANLLTRGGRLAAVIDFGCLGVGDPACDAMAAWTFLSVETRGAFRDAIAAENATWARGRGWALSFALIALPYYQSSNAVLAGIARRVIDETLRDYLTGA